MYFIAYYHCSILVTIVKYMKNKYYTKYNIDDIIK